MMDLRLALVMISCSLLGYSLAEWLAFRRENRVLRLLLGRLLGPGWNGRIESLDQARVLKRFLNDRIAWVGLDKRRYRPLLRESAQEILASGLGYCGENARVAVRMLNLAGVRANRIYLWNERWGHVACEMDWDGKRKLFDGHIDYEHPIPDEAIGVLDSDDFTSFPNSDKEYPWVDYGRIKLLHKVPVLSRLKRTRLPFPLTHYVECPALLRSLVALFAAVATFGLSRLV